MNEETDPYIGKLYEARLIGMNSSVEKERLLMITKKDELNNNRAEDSRHTKYIS